MYEADRSHKYVLSIGTYMFLLITKILEVNLFAFAYKLFPEEFSPINGVQTTIKRQMQTNELLESLCIKAPHRALYHL